MGAAIRPQLALLFSLLPINTIAQICAPYPVYEVSRQEDLDAISQNCTAIDGRIRILTNYIGPLVLPNVTNITGTVSLDYSLEGTSLTSLEFPDLVYAGKLSLYSLTSLKNVSLPRLEYAGSINLAVPAELAGLEFPALRNSSWINLAGSRSVRYKLSTVSSRSATRRGATSLSLLENRWILDLSFPVLERVQNLEVIGSVSSLFAPELASIVPLVDEATYSHSLKFGLHGEPVSVDLRKLSRIEDNAVIKGNITSPSLPALRNYAGLFGVDSDEVFYVNLPVESAGDISLMGKIQSAEFPNLTNFTEFNIWSDLPFDCGAFVDALEETVTDVTVEEHENVFCISGAGALGSGARAAAVIAVVVTLVEIL
ncbi:hypothetical protein BDW62DRAFT_205476 [Aspergillus aurantiobrunneus]